MQHNTQSTPLNNMNIEASLKKTTNPSWVGDLDPKPNPSMGWVWVPMGTRGSCRSLLEITVSHCLSTFAEGTKTPTMTGMGVYCWPLLHRPGVTRTTHQYVDSRFTGPVPITIITNSQPLLTSRPHLQPLPSTRQHTTYSPSKLRISLLSDKICCHC
jgi:hypothetical protein